MLGRACPNPSWEVRTNQSLTCGSAVLFEFCTVHHKQKILRHLSEDFCGGRYRTRTCDLLHVKQMLYQLS